MAVTSTASSWAICRFLGSLSPCGQGADQGHPRVRRADEMNSLAYADRVTPSEATTY